MTLLRYFISTVADELQEARYSRSRGMFLFF